MGDDPFNSDKGRMKITGRSEDSLKFRVPTLRNVMVTAPYGHDGRFFSLIEVPGTLPEAGKGDAFDRQPDAEGIHCRNFEIGQLTAFLYTLTDSAFIADQRFALPPDMYLPQAADAAEHQRVR